MREALWECGCVCARGSARVLAPHTILCPQVFRNFLEIVKHHWSVCRVQRVWRMGRVDARQGEGGHLGAWSERSLARRRPWRTGREHVGVQLSPWSRLERQAASSDGLPRLELASASFGLEQGDR